MLQTLKAAGTGGLGFQVQGHCDRYTYSSHVKRAYAKSSALYPCGSGSGRGGGKPSHLVTVSSP